MRFRIQVTSGGEPWWETYDKDTDDAQKWAEDTIAFYNSGLRGKEKARTLLAVEVLGDEQNECPAEHHWEKTNVMTIAKRGQYYDTCRCKRCGITGKRFGLGDPVRDKEFKAKVYEKCNMAVAHLEKKRALSKS